MMSVFITHRRMMLGQPSGGPYVLDGISGAAAAFSLYKLKAGVTNCLKVRRTSDDTELDIGFSGDYIDQDALETFCAGTDGYVRAWYDQSGNANNAIRAGTNNTQQPKIAASGSMLEGLYVDGADSYLLINHDASLNATTGISLWAKLKMTASGANSSLFINKTNSYFLTAGYNRYLRISLQIDGAARVFEGSQFAADTILNLAGTYAESSAVRTLYINGNVDGADELTDRASYAIETSTDEIRLRLTGNSTISKGYYYGVIIFPNVTLNQTQVQSLGTT